MRHSIGLVEPWSTNYAPRRDARRPSARSRRREVRHVGRPRGLLARRWPGHRARPRLVAPCSTSPGRSSIKVGLRLRNGARRQLHDGRPTAGEMGNEARGRRVARARLRRSLLQPAPRLSPCVGDVGHVRGCDLPRSCSRRRSPTTFFDRRFSSPRPRSRCSCYPTVDSRLVWARAGIGRRPRRLVSDIRRRASAPLVTPRPSGSCDSCSMSARAPSMGSTTTSTYRCSEPNRKPHRPSSRPSAATERSGRSRRSSTA